MTLSDAELHEIGWRTPEELYAIGGQFGYPDCCIADFVARWEEDIRAPRGRAFEGTGYIPCPACSERAKADLIKFVREVIAPRRTFDKGFPDDGMEPRLEPYVLEECTP